MESQAGKDQGENSGSEYKSFAVKRIIVAAVLIIAVIWALGIGLNIFDRSTGPSAKSRLLPAPVTNDSVPHADSHSPEGSSDQPSPAHEATSHSGEAAVASQPEPATATTEPAAGNDSHTAPAEHASQAASLKSESPPAHDQAAETQPHAEAAGQEKPATTESHPAETPAQGAEHPRGVAFVEAVIKPLDYELNKRFWGWRPNDIINFTDNTNNFQLGVLEVTRRSTVMLTDRISRTGSTDRLDPHLEDASNWLMVTATRYWFPSPESKYEECIKELQAYEQELIEGDGTFYIRADNLIPLLASYEDLLGSCDENLVKQKNADGSSISFFNADDYFYYAKGVASAMATILEAVHHEFLPTLESRHGTELLHHALLSCRQAAALCPLIITDARLDGILANHRANMAAPISHARYFISQLIKTLST
jgi:Uncharacterized protein conserved in bacteria (DUF2333)